MPDTDFTPAIVAASTARLQRVALARQLRLAVAEYRGAWWPFQIAKAFRIADIIERNIASVEDALHKR